MSRKVVSSSAAVALDFLSLDEGSYVFASVC